MAREPKQNQEEEFVPPPAPPLPSKDGRKHRATFAKDKVKGGYLIRVIGPHASKMAGRWLPVTKLDNSETMEFAIDLITSGPDEDSGTYYALYSMYRKPKEQQDEIPF